MTMSGVSPSEGRKARNAALRMWRNSSRSRCRKASASASACREVLSFRAGSGSFETQTSGGRVIQSHSAKSPRNWSRKIWMGARESSPKRRRLRVARTKSATSYTCRMAPCVRCMRGGPGRQGEKEQELESSRQFEDQGQLLLESQHDHQRHHGEPLPSRPPEPFDPAGKAEQSRHERLVSRVSWHGGADARDCKKAREEQLEQKGSLIHASGAHCKATAIHAGTRRKRPWVPLTRRKHAWSDSSADAGDATESWNQRGAATFLSGGRSRVPPSEDGISCDDDPGRTAGSFSSVAGTDSDLLFCKTQEASKLSLLCARFAAPALLSSGLSRP